MGKVPKEEFDAWLDNPITRGLLALVRDEAEAYRGLAAQGAALQGESFEKVGEKYFSLMTTAKVYETLLDNLTYEYVIGDNEEAQDEV